MTGVPYPLRSQMAKVELRGADLTGADLSGAYLSEATVARTGLRGVNLRGAKGLTHEQIERAFGDRTTRLPDHLQYPESWRS